MQKGPLSTHAFEGRWDLVEAMVDAGADLRTQDGFMVLCGAILAAKNPLLAEKLIDQGAPMDPLSPLLPDENNLMLNKNIIFCLAAALGSRSLMQKFIAAGANPNTAIINPKGQSVTPLSVAVENGHLAIVQELRSNGARVYHELLPHAARHSEALFNALVKDSPYEEDSEYQAYTMLAQVVAALPPAIIYGQWRRSRVQSPVPMYDQMRDSDYDSDSDDGAHYYHKIFP